MASLRKSAVAIVLARGVDGGLRVLVGRRSRRSGFLPGYHAFPGGVLEATDGDLRTEGEDACLRRTAVRELHEETGVRLAPADLLPAGRRITPAIFLRRFDTLMYVASLEREAPVAGNPEEMEEIGWEPPRELIRRWRELEIRLAPPLIPILQALALVETGDAARVAARLAAVNADMEADGPRIEFVPDVLMVPLDTPTLPPATTTNCYLVGSDEILVIDPGSAETAEVERLLRHVERRVAEGTRPRAVVLTHDHGDHVGGAARVAAKLRIPVLAHEATWARWEGGVPIRETGLAGELRDGEVIELSGGERLRVLHTPGHAPGHLALHEEGNGSLFAGDLVSGISTVLVDSPAGSLDLYLASLVRIRDAGARTIFPAHGPPLTSPERAVQKALDHRYGRERRILAALESGPLRVPEIVDRAYRDTPDAPAALAARQAESHLGRLLDLGRVRCDAGLWSLAGPPPAMPGDPG